MLQCESEPCFFGKAAMRFCRKLSIQVLSIKYQVSSINILSTAVPDMFCNQPPGAVS